MLTYRLYLRVDEEHITSIERIPDLPLGLDDPELRKNGTGGMLDELGRWLERQAATA
jgi:hypothetical protein